MVHLIPKVPSVARLRTADACWLQAPLKNWVAVKELNLGYHNPETTLFGTCPYSGNLN